MLVPNVNNTLMTAGPGSVCDVRICAQQETAKQQSEVLLASV